MKPVDQTRPNYPDGNCFAASLASLLELSLEEMPVPTCADGDGWWKTWLDWLRDRNLTLITFKNNSEWKPEGYCLAAVKSPRGHWNHSVVTKDGVIVHDPHPDKDAFDKPIIEWDMIYPLDPALPIGKLAKEQTA